MVDFGYLGDEFFDLGVVDCVFDVDVGEDVG